MMDLKEARASLDFYTSNLEVHCSLYGLVVKVTAAEAKMRGSESGTAGQMDQAVAELTRVRRESLVVNIMIAKALQKEADRCVCLPGELADLWEAQNRLAAAQSNAATLLQEHEQKEIEKNAPRKPSDFQIAIREYREKQRSEQRSQGAAANDE